MSLAIVALASVGCSEEDVANVLAEADAFTIADTGVGQSDTGDTSPSFANGCKSDSECAGVVFADLGICERSVCNLQTKQCERRNAPEGTACSDEDGCTTGDQCTLGTCAGSTKGCDDKNPCTDDKCNPTSGACESTPNTAICDDGNLCTTEDACAGGTCTGKANPTCQCSVDADCKQFDDADLCNGVLECKNKQCVPKDGTVVTCGGETADPCATSACEPTTGKCVSTPTGDGGACDDGNACTKSDRCTAGKCDGKPVNCDDHNACTTDSCEPKDGCAHAPLAGDCDDQNPCTTGDLCKDGACTGTLNPECGCATTADCAKNEDGDLCNGTLICDAGKCVVDTVTVVSCAAEAAAAGVCKTSICEPTTGKCATRTALDGASCDDSTACTSGDVCKAGACKGKDVVCDDMNPCTTDSCSAAKGCETTPNTASCDDGNACTTGDICAAGQCAGSGTCACTTTADCAQQEDKDLCNGTLACVSGKCELDPKTVVTCTGGSFCETSQCIADTGKCITKAKAEGDACDDGDACTSGDACKLGSCKGSNVVCDDNNPCTADSCETGTGCVYAYNNAACDDGVTCTSGDHCDLGTCSGIPSSTCTCAVDADCGQFEDKNACNGTLICQLVGGAGKCVVSPKTVVLCEPSGTPCAASVCNPTTGACGLKNAANEKPCDDGSECTSGDKCKDGACKSDTAVTCDDTNPCTTDACDPETGCRYTPNTESCDDGDTCTEGDVCKDGACQPGATNTCANNCQADFTLQCGDFDSWGTGEAGATNVITTYSCTADEYPGPEYTYLFSAPFDGTVRATLANEDTITDIMVLEQGSTGCDPKSCVATDYSSVVAPMVASKNYYFVVDGYLNETGGYTISVDCTPSHEQGCENGFDEDDDGDTDCADADCAAEPVCAPAKCEPDWTLTCGASDSWANYSAGSTNTLTTYDGCNNPFSGDYTGPEYTYVYDAPITGAITVRLTDESSADTDVMVLADASGYCVPSQCLGWGLSEVTFEATAGTRYYFVVDGYNASEGSFTLTVDCPTDVETACTDAEDNDGDNLVDCADSDCSKLPVCAETCNPIFDLPVVCGDSLGLSTADPTITKDVSDTYSCNEYAYPGPEASATFVAPFDGTVTFSLSNETADLDVLVMSDDVGLCLPASCLDSDLTTVTVTVEAGKTYYVVVDGYQGETGDFTLDVACKPTSEQSCTDGLDEDGDGLVDCEDGDCFYTSFDCELACTPDTDVASAMTCDIDEDTYNNSAAGSTNVVSHYACNTYTYSGPEYVYTYVAETDGPISAFLSSESAETDIVVLEDKGLGCNPASCLTWDLDQTTFTAKKGTTYYIVVDGFAGAEGDFTLNFLCGPL